MDLLITDDEAQLRKILLRYFEHHGWAAMCAESCEQALSLLDENAFDVVITDIRMPGASGMALLEEIKRQSPATQVILMTGYRDLKAAIDAVNQGAFAYVEKPFKLKDLHDRALEALEEKHRIDSAEEERSNLASLVGQKEEELSLLRERSEAILRIIPSLLVLVDHEGRVRDVNEPFLRVFGRRKNRKKGLHLCDTLLCPRSRKGPCSEACELFRVFKQTAASGKPSKRFVVSLPFTQESQTVLPTFQVRILPLPSLPSVEEIDREFLITLEDITKERAMEMQILQSSRLASLGEMATGIAHELSQPLNVISTQAQLMNLKMKNQGRLPEDLTETAVQEIVDQVFRMSDILHHLRVYGRHHAAAEYSEFTPEHLLDGSLKLMQSQLRAWGISLSVESQPQLPRIRGKLHELQHALTNVLLNARDALCDKTDRRSPAEKKEGTKEIRVRLRSFQRKGVPWDCIEVMDNGPGMTAAALARAFDPLFTTKAEGGSGLGLPISATILRNHGGLIHIDQADEGTTVRLEIPALSE
jgi:signal transduction histidine kinase/DNA-binding response OmpR family regulator